MLKGVQHAFTLSGKAGIDQNGARATNEIRRDDPKTNPRDFDLRRAGWSSCHRTRSLRPQAVMLPDVPKWAGGLGTVAAPTFLARVAKACL